MICPLVAGWRAPGSQPPPREARCGATRGHDARSELWLEGSPHPQDRCPLSTCSSMSSVLISCMYMYLGWYDGGSQVVLGWGSQGCFFGLSRSRRRSTHFPSAVSSVPPCTSTALRARRLFLLLDSHCAPPFLLLYCWSVLKYAWWFHKHNSTISSNLQFETI